MVRQAMEDYLKAIYSLQTTNEDQLVSTTSLATILDCSPASVTNMVQKLSDHGLVDYILTGAFDLPKTVAELPWK